MDNKFERQNAAGDLLSQSYCIGIQKIAGTDNAIFSDFQVSHEILDKRREAWNSLFEKYSSMVSEVELNINTLQPEELMEPSEGTEQRFPMRKPMSMVQYWVDTGNLQHTNSINNHVKSDSGSSIIEDNCEPNQEIDSQSLATDPSAQKHSNIAEISGNKNLRIVPSSNSSVDTAAYILANNNITKKAETIAIVEGSKVDVATLSPVKNTSQIIRSSKIANKIDLTRKSSNEKLNISNPDFSQSCFFKSCMNKITENLKNANYDKISQNKSCKPTPQANNVCSIFFSDSDESQKAGIENNKIDVLDKTSQNVSKLLKRKKLYNRSDSPAEFTPVSEDNLSFQTSKVLLRKLKKSEHPALETPKISSKLLCRPRYRQTKFKRKFNPRLSSVSTSDDRSKSHELLNLNESNVISVCLSKSEIQKTENNDISTKNHIYNKESNVKNSRDNVNDLSLSELSMVDKPLAHTSSLSSCSELLISKLKLKSCRIEIQRLPYKYCSLNLSKTLNNNRNILYPVKAKKMKDTNTNVKTFDNKKITQDVLNSKREKLLSKTNSNHCSDKLKLLEMKFGASRIWPIDEISRTHLEMTNHDSKYKEPSRYVIVDSSSDESDLIVPLSSTKNESVGKLKNSKRLSNAQFSQQSGKNVKLKKEIQNGECLNISTGVGVNNGEVDDVQYNEMKENICSDKMASSNSRKRENKKKKALVTSSLSEEETLISTNQNSQFTSVIPLRPDTKNCDNSQSSKSPRTKEKRRLDKSQILQIPAKDRHVKKASPQKRKTFDINLSSDEECIIPLKRKESK